MLWILAVQQARSDSQTTPHWPLQIAVPHTNYFWFNRSCFEWKCHCFQAEEAPPWAAKAGAVLWAPGLAFAERPVRHHAPQLWMAALLFSSAMINEFLLMDFWLAFSRHLAHSSASCHSSNGTAHDPDKGSAGWRIILPFCFFYFVKNALLMFSWK